MKIIISYRDTPDSTLHKSLQIKLPKKWRTGPVSKIVALFVKNYNKKFPDNTLDEKTIHMEVAGNLKLAADAIANKHMESGDQVFLVNGAPPRISDVPVLPPACPVVEPAAEAAATKPAAAAAAGAASKLVKCKNYGCRAMFDPDNNPEGSCCHHVAPPTFHDAKKGWMCCKSRMVYDWADFEKIKGCTRGRHSTVDPKVKFAPSPTVANALKAEARNPTKIKSIESYKKQREAQKAAAPRAPVAKKKAKKDDKGRYKCINKGCKVKWYFPADNGPTACRYHSGMPVFHDTKKYWKCCPAKVCYDFDTFMAVPGCAVGRHNNGENDE